MTQAKLQSMRWTERLISRPGRDQDAVASDMAAAYEASVRGDYAVALELWAPLAHAGIPRAQNNIGACFDEGLGVERDEALAMIFHNALGAAYHLGAGVSRDPVGALALLLRAKANGSALADPFISTAQQSLSTDELAEAERRALALEMEQVA